MAFALTFCMSFSGAVPVGAVSVNEEEIGQQQAQAIEGISENLIEAVSQGEIEEPLEENEDFLPPEEPAVSENTVSGQPEEFEEPEEAVETPFEEPSEELVNSEERAAVSGNQIPQGGYVVDSPKWILAGTQMQLEKPEGGSVFTEEDGLIYVRSSNAYYAFDKQGNMRTGKHELNVNVTPQGTYYFLTGEECEGVQTPTPENSKIGQMVTQAGWHYVPGEDAWLYLQEGGLWDSSKVGMQKISDEKTYFLNKNGVVQKDVQKTIDGSNYYFDTDGAMAINSFKNISGKQYYFGEDGKRLEATGWQRLNGSFYYFHNKHYRVIKTKWQEITENGAKGWYYFEPEGEDCGTMYKETFFDVGNYRYYVNKNGKMLTGLQQINGKKYYFRTAAEGKNPIGSAVKGWKKVGAYWYYFKNNYQAQTSSVVKISGKYYFFEETGRMYKGGWKEIDGKTYYFQKQTSTARNGDAVTKKWLKRSGKWYYATAKGYMRTNSWLKYKGNLYYLNAKGVMVTNKWKQYNGKWGYLNGDGIYSQKWIKKNGKWKYAKDDGSFAKGWTYITQNGTRYKYYFDNSGFLQQDIRGKVSGPYMLRIDRKRNQITVYAKDTNGTYNIPVVAMPCSVGRPETPTPTGRFTATKAGRWQSLMGPSWGQYGILVEASSGIYIHSVPGASPNVYSVPAGEWNLLGRSPASHGCIRVAVIDGKWMYENCNGAIVEIADYANAGPFDHKTYRPITAAYNWDPTDPAAKGYL